MAAVRDGRRVPAGVAVPGGSRPLLGGGDGAEGDSWRPVPPSSQFRKSLKGHIAEGRVHLLSCTHSYASSFFKKTQHLNAGYLQCSK